MAYQETKADRLAMLVGSIAHAQAALTQAEACVRRVNHYASGTFETDTPQIVAARVVTLVDTLEHLKRNVAQILHAQAIAQSVQKMPELPEPLKLAGGFLDDGPDVDEAIADGERAVDNIEAARERGE